MNNILADFPGVVVPLFRPARTSCMIYAKHICARENLRRCQNILPRNGINDATSGTAVNQVSLFHLATSGNIINNS